MRDEQVRRYARHILLSDVGGLGQTALMVSTAQLELRESEPEAELIAVSYLAAGGVGTIVLRGATDAQLAALAAHGPDTKLTATTDGLPEYPLPRPVLLAPRPAWWPSADHDSAALAFWRGGVAATKWMADVANR